MRVDYQKLFAGDAVRWEPNESTVKNCQRFFLVSYSDFGLHISVGKYGIWL
jgi:hypothetical protein